MAGSLLKGGVKTLGMKLVNIGTMFLATVALTRTLGAEQYGIYVFVFTLVVVLAEPQFAGLRTVAVRNTAIYLDEGQLGLLSGLIRRLGHFVFLGALLSAVVLLITAWFMQEKFGAGSGWIFVIAAGLPLFLGLNRIRDGMLRGAGTVVAGQFPKLIVRPALLLLYIGIAWWMLGDAFDAKWAMGMQVLAATSAGLIYALLLRRYLGDQLRSDQVEYRTKEWFGGMVPVMFSGIIQIIDARAGVLMVGFLQGVADTGQFHAAFRLAELIAMAHAVANIVIEPIIARLYNAGNIEELQKKITRTARLVLAATVPTSLILIFAGEWLLSIFGEEFRAATPALSILAVTQIVNAALGAVGPLLNMTNHARETAIGLLLGVSVNVVLGFILIPESGIEGAAWAALGSIVVWKTYLMIRVHKLLGIHTTALGAFNKGRKWQGDEL